MLDCKTPCKQNKPGGDFFSLSLKPKMNSLLQCLTLASLETWCDMIGLILIYLHIFVVVAVVVFTRQLVYIYAHIYGPDAVRGGAMMTLSTGNPLLPFLGGSFILFRREAGIKAQTCWKKWGDGLMICSLSSHTSIYIYEKDVRCVCQPATDAGEKPDLSKQQRWAKTWRVQNCSQR